MLNRMRHTSLLLLGCVLLVIVTAACSLSPAESYYTRGWEYLEQGDYENAIESFTEAIRLDPQDRSYNSRGIAYAGLSQYERAIQDYDVSILFDPQEAGVYRNRGEAYYYLGQHERAIQDYDEAMRIEPHQILTTSIVALFYSGLLFSAMIEFLMQV